MARIDLDAELAAKSEAIDEDHVIVFRGREFTIPAAAPFTFVEATREGKGDLERVGLAARAIVGDQWDDFLAARPTMEEAGDFVRHVLKLWGLGEDLGESQASGGSSGATSRRSKPTSNGSTGSTSRKRSGAPIQ